MARRSQKSAPRRRKVGDDAPRTNVIQPVAPAQTGGREERLLELATQQILAVTYWFDPPPQAGSSPVTIRFSGQRVDVLGRHTQRDRFVQDETIEQVVPGSGPISLTARVRGINAGFWAVTAKPLSSTHSARGAREPGKTISAAAPLPLLVRLWRRWAPDTNSVESVHTCLIPFIHVPGILPGIWSVMVVLGMVVALALQFLVISRERLAVDPVWTISLLAIAVGIIGAKVWYVLLSRRFNGWCIQGFVLASILTAALLLIVFGVNPGVFLDATAPGLLFGMAVGRIGCFFAGCCGGPPTASRLSVWSSDQRVGARRVPTQLMESTLAGILGFLALIAILNHGPAAGAFFAASLAAYTLGRQGILLLRAERRRTRLGTPIIASLSALVLIVALVWIAR